MIIHLLTNLLFWCVKVRQIDKKKTQTNKQKEPSIFHCRLKLVFEGITVYAKLLANYDIISTLVRKPITDSSLKTYLHQCIQLSICQSVLAWPLKYGSKFHIIPKQCRDRGQSIGTNSSEQADVNKISSLYLKV